MAVGAIIATTTQTGGTRISIRVDVRRAMKKVQAFNTAIDKEALLNAIGLRGVRWAVDNLDQAGLDAAHTPMAESTIAQRPQRTSDRHFSSRYRSRLAQSFVHRVEADGVWIGTQDEFAAYHHFGTEPRIIRAVNRRFLRFMTASGYVFRKEVNHPGIPARPLLPEPETARDFSVEVVEAAVAVAVQRAQQAADEPLDTEETP